MDDAGVDLLLAHTPHNIRYLTGGYYFHFRERVAAIGPSQYLPFVGIPKKNSENAFQVAWRVEASPRNEGGHLDTRRHLHEGAGNRRRLRNGRRSHQEAGAR